ncbi:MAG: hypothetical protein K8U57_08895 [Planctomycetes bacterium]|nr:hypothetical protein [Planctomycetota bacterium]
MRRITFVIGVSAFILLAAGHESHAQRGGRGGGGGGGRGGAMGVGGGSVGARPAIASAPVAGTGTGGGTRNTVVGPAGGTKTTGSGSGSYTTAGGSTINYAGAGKGGTTAGGVNYGKGAGAVQVTTPGGQTVTKAGTAGGVAGPGGNGVAGRSGVTTASGPNGTAASAYKGGVAVGPQGAATAGTRVGTATNAAGQTVSGAAHGGAAVGPYGAVAGGTKVAGTTGPGGTAVAGSRTVAGKTTYGTTYASRTTLAATGTAVRTNFHAFATQYPVLTARWLGPTWRPITWAALSSYGGYPAEPMSYDYGESVVYSGNTVTINGDTEVPADQYAQQATDIAMTGKEAKVDPKMGEWQPLGVFAMVGQGEEKSTNIFQLAINKDGIIGGEYYNALTDTTEPVSGAVDKKTQRAAWTVGDRKSPVYEAGIENLTQNETTMLVHFSKENRQQFTLVRLPPPEGDQPMGEKK